MFVSVQKERGFMTEMELEKKLLELSMQQAPASKTQRKTGREYRRLQFIRKNDRLMRIVANRYIPHAGYITGRFEGKTLLHTGKYIKYPKNSRAQQWLKRKAARSVRRCGCRPVKGNHYRRLFDYWWMLY